jgi:pilus assembly protein Flp/PilA
MDIQGAWLYHWYSEDSGRRSRRLESGASAVEYGLLIAGIAAIIAVAVFAFGGGSTGMFQDSCKTIMTDHSVGSCS